MEISYQTGSAAVTCFSSRAQLLYSRKRSGDHQLDQNCDTSVKPAKVRWKNRHFSLMKYIILN